MQPVQLGHYTLHTPDDSIMVRVDRKGHVVEPAELETHLIQQIFIEHLFAWHCSLWGEKD